MIVWQENLRLNRLRSRIVTIIISIATKGSIQDLKMVAKKRPTMGLFAARRIMI